MDDLVRLRALLKVREGKPGFKANAEEIRNRIAQLEGRK